MSGFVFHPEALVDLEEIWEFIADESLSGHLRVILSNLQDRSHCLNCTRDNDPWRTFDARPNSAMLAKMPNIRRPSMQVSTPPRKKGRHAGLGVANSVPLILLVA